MDTVGPLLGAGVFVLGMSRVGEPLRLRLNALLVVGASGVYLSGGLGGWELLYAFAAGPLLGFWALRSYRGIAAGWLLHSTWDAVHHFFGRPIWEFMPTSSWGCLWFDAAIAMWLFWLPTHQRPATSGGT